MKLFDCFTFFNELDILEVRLEYLYSHVDFFVIVESDHTHTAKPKEYILEKNKDRFKKYWDKILYIKQHANITNTIGSFAKEYSPKDEFWRLENDQRNAISEGLSAATPNDIIMISDVDEIPNTSSIKQLKRALFFSKKRAFSQQLHLYFVNCFALGKDQNWVGTVACKMKYLKTPQDLRNNRHLYKLVHNGGWHLSYLGGLENIIKKIESFAHTEFNQDKFKRKDEIMLKIKSGKDIYDRDGHSTQLVDPEKIKMDEQLLSILKRNNNFFLND